MGGSLWLATKTPVGNRRPRTSAGINRRTWFALCSAMLRLVEDRRLGPDRSIESLDPIAASLTQRAASGHSRDTTDSTGQGSGPRPNSCSVPSHRLFLRAAFALSMASPPENHLKGSFPTRATDRDHITAERSSQNSRQRQRTNPAIAGRHVCPIARRQLPPFFVR